MNNEKFWWDAVGAVVGLTFFGVIIWRLLEQLIWAIKETKRLAVKTPKAPEYLKVRRAIDWDKLLKRTALAAVIFTVGGFGISHWAKIVDQSVKAYQAKRQSCRGC